MRALLAVLAVSFLGCTANDGVSYGELDSGNSWAAQIKPEEVGNYVPWREAIEILLESPEKIDAVWQAHSLRVSIIFKDQTYLGTIEPDIDTIFSVVRECGERCDHIMWITE